MLDRARGACDVLGTRQREGITRTLALRDAKSTIGIAPQLFERRIDEQHPHRGPNRSSEDGSERRELDAFAAQGETSSLSSAS